PRRTRKPPRPAQPELPGLNRPPTEQLPDAEPGDPLPAAGQGNLPGLTESRILPASRRTGHAGESDHRHAAENCPAAPPSVPKPAGSLSSASHIPAASSDSTHNPPPNLSAPESR